MLDALTRLLGLGDLPHSAEPDPDHRLRLATAALMIEAARMDGHLDDVERDRIHALLRERFGMGEGEVAALVAAADEAASESADWYGFTKVVTDSLDADERIRIIEMMWEVAYADGELHDLEASLMRRLGGLLYVSERDRGEARKRVRVRLGLDN